MNKKSTVSLSMLYAGIMIMFMTIFLQLMFDFRGYVLLGIMLLAFACILVGTMIEIINNHSIKKMIINDNIGAKIDSHISYEYKCNKDNADKYVANCIKFINDFYENGIVIKKVQNEKALTKLYLRKNFLLHKNDYQSIFSGASSFGISLGASAIAVIIGINQNFSSIIDAILIVILALVIMYMINLAKYSSMRNYESYIWDYEVEKLNKLIEEIEKDVAEKCDCLRDYE